LQLSLVKLSMRGRQVMVENSTQLIPLLAPQAVVEAIRRELSDVAGGPSNILR
jgi:hypothetical protein